MSVPLELLRKLNLPPEQLAMLETASRQQQTKSELPSPRSNHDDLSHHLERILNAPTGLNKWSTDPINRMSFLMPNAEQSKKQGSLKGSKSVENLLRAAVGKENNKFTQKRGSEAEDEERDCEVITQGGLKKKAKSIESLAGGTRFNNPFSNSKSELKLASPPPVPVREKGMYSPTVAANHEKGMYSPTNTTTNSRAHQSMEAKSPAETRQMYAWTESNNPVKRSPIAQSPSIKSPAKTIKSTTSTIKSPTATINSGHVQQPVVVQPTLSPSANAAARPPSRFSLSRFSIFSSRKASTTTSPTNDAVIVKTPEIKQIQCTTISPSKPEDKPIDEPKEMPKEESKAVPKPVMPVKRDFSLQDLMLELGVPSATSSLNVEPPMTANDDDKYGSFYELRPNNTETNPQQQPLILDFPSNEFELEEVLSATQSEPALSFASGLLSEPDSDNTRNMKSPSKSNGITGMLQRRFFSKHQTSSLGSSQVTIVGCQQSSIDALLLDDALPSTCELPVLSPSYSAFLNSPSRNNQVKSIDAGKPEYETLHDPQTSVLLQGVREEITANDGMLYLNYRNCMRHKHTVLPISFTELKHRIEEYGLDIKFQEEPRARDTKQLFLLPLNDATVPRWVPPGTTFRIGRQANWFLAQTRVVSRNHCELFHDIHSYYIRDIGSRSGTFVNGTRLSPAEQLSLPKELKHGDILQVGVDLTAEADHFGQIPDRFKSGQCIVLYGYKARASVPSQMEIEDLAPTQRFAEEKRQSYQPPTSNLISISDSKFERMQRKAMASKSKLSSANTRLYIEFGDYISETAAGTAILCRKQSEPSYSFAFNNYRLSWDISMTCKRTGKVFGMKLDVEELGKPSSYIIYEGNPNSSNNVKAVVTLQEDHKLLVEPIYQTNLLDEQMEASEMHAHQHQDFRQPSIYIPSPSPYLIASPLAQGPGRTASVFSQMIPSVSLPSYATTVAQSSSVTPRNPFYTITGDIEGGGLAFYVERYQNCRKQVFLGEGQLGARKSQWGKKTIFYEARLPPAENNDDLLAIVTLFNVLNQVEKF